MRQEAIEEKVFSVKRPAFTLVELLVVISIIALLLGILMPALAHARGQGYSIVCRSNVRQLYLANMGYSLENDDYYVLAAEDIMIKSGGGRHRWHGMRESYGVDPDPLKNTFDPYKGPLYGYLGGGKVKECPGMRSFIKDGAKNAFEAGCGGFGYNFEGVGSRMYKWSPDWSIPYDNPAKYSMRSVEISRADTKVMFADTGYEVDGGIIEYSFCQPPKYVLNLYGAAEEKANSKPKPTIHFRHFGSANVAWCDGHVSDEKLSFPESQMKVGDEAKIGWFGPADNSLFRP